MKTLYIIRHGEGFHNINSNYDLKYPVLTKKGKSQAIQNRNFFKDKIIDIVYVSPLTRTLQTADLIFKNKNTSIVAIEDIREKLNEQCNVRKDINILKNIFPNIDFNLIKNNIDPTTNSKSKNGFNYESTYDVNKRIKKFIHFLKKTKKSRIAIVSHYVFIYQFLKYIKYGGSLHLGNCDIRVVKF